jgi:hypothetical protein
MKKVFIASMLALGVFATAGFASAGGKPDGASCHVSKSCKSSLCVRLSPTDKFGVCCTPQDCPAVGAQCGSVDNGCGIPQDCGSCDPGSSCVSNQCVLDTTTTTTTSSTTSTTSGPPGCNDCIAADYCNQGLGCVNVPNTDGACGNACIHSDYCGNLAACSTTSDCNAGETCITGCCGSGVCALNCEPTTTTTLPSSSCEGHCGGSAPSGCHCDSGGCGFDNCADVDTFCSVCF